MVEPETAISVSVRFGQVYLTCFRHRMFFVQGLNFGLHVARPIDLLASYLSVCPSVRK